ncbi:MAG: hypothetical protein P4L87_02040 [Formivibrio sp.]|nr:hypothetical protein [Formivibrio sp.]
MMPEDLVGSAISAGSLIEIAPGHHLDVPLYWHRWRLASPALEAVTQAVRTAAKVSLHPIPGA